MLFSIIKVLPTGAVLVYQKQLSSYWYSNHIFPLRELLKGNEWFGMGCKLDNQAAQNLIKQLKNPHLSPFTIHQLRSTIKLYMEAEHITPEELESLKKFHDTLESISPEEVSLMAEEIYYNLRSIAEDCIREAGYLYGNKDDNKADRIPEFTNIRKQLSLCSYRLTNYQSALNLFIGLTKIPLNNGFANAEFQVLNSAPMEIDAIRVDEESQTIQVSSQSEWHPVLRFQGLSDAECQYLAGVFAEDDIRQRINVSKLTPAYGILFTPIPVPPQTRLWIEVLKSLETWLIKALAFTGILPVETDTPPTEEILSVYDDAPVITRVEVNSADAIERFLENIGQKRMVTVQEI